MKKYIPICSVLLLLIFVLSCKGQKEVAQPKNIASQSKQTESHLAEIDPYFTASSAISSPYGPSSITRNIIQDKKGAFWFATWEGILYYDGKHFTNVTNKEGLRPFRVFTILEDKNGHIWFGTIGAGVYHYDGKRFRNLTTKEGLVNDRVTCILEAKNGHMWFGTTAGLSQYDGSSFRNFTTKEGLSNNDVNSIIEDEKGQIWLGTRGNACFYDGKTFTNFSTSEGQNFENVRSIIEDKKGNIWLGGNDGLWSYDGRFFRQFTKNFVGYIYEDKAGHIWTSSATNSNGNTNSWMLSKYDQASLKNKKIPAIPIKAEKGMLFGIIEDTEGNIWFGSLNGVYRYDGTSFSHFQNH